MKWDYRKCSLDKWRPWHVIWHFVAGMWFKYPMCCILQFCFFFMIYPITGRILLARNEGRGWNECYFHRRKR